MSFFRGVLLACWPTRAGAFAERPVNSGEAMLPPRVPHPGGSDLQPPAALAALLARADVQFNGQRPWDIQVRHPRLYRRLLAHRSEERRVGKECRL